MGGQAADADPAAVAVAGSDRYQSCVAVAAQFFPDPTAVGIATGLDFPDGLAGGASAFAQGGPLLLSDPGGLTPSAVAYLTGHESTITNVYLDGGTSVPPETTGHRSTYRNQLIGFGGLGSNSRDNLPASMPCAAAATSGSCRGRVPNSGWPLPGQLVDHELVAHLRVDRGNVAVLDPGHDGAGLGGSWRVAVLQVDTRTSLSGAVDGERGAVFAGAEGVFWRRRLKLSL